MRFVFAKCLKVNILRMGVRTFELSGLTMSKAKIVLLGIGEIKRFARGKRSWSYEIFAYIRRRHEQKHRKCAG